MSKQIIDPNDPEFQLGRYIHDAEVLRVDANLGQIDLVRVKELCERYCRLAHLTGQLRAECERLEHKVSYAQTVLMVLGNHLRNGKEELDK